MHNLANLKTACAKSGCPGQERPSNFPGPTLHFSDGETETREMNGVSKNTQGVSSGLRETTVSFSWLCSSGKKKKKKTHALVVVKEVTPSAARVSESTLLQSAALLNSVTGASQTSSPSFMIPAAFLFIYLFLNFQVGVDGLPLCLSCCWKRMSQMGQVLGG